LSQHETNRRGQAIYQGVLPEAIDVGVVLRRLLPSLLMQGANPRAQATLLIHAPTPARYASDGTLVRERVCKQL